MFNSIRKSIAQFIAPSVGHITIPENYTGPKTLTIPSNVRTQQRTNITPDNQMKSGKFYPDHLGLLSSQYLKDAIAGLGAWSNLALAFSAYAKMQQRKASDTTAYEQYKEAFHIWNSATSTDKQMDEEKVIIALDRIAEVPVKTGNDATDAIIARVTSKTVEEVRAERIVKAEKETTKRKEMLSAICADIWQYSGEEVETYLSSAKVAAKAVQTIEWVANSWQGDPTSIAAELLLIEDDIKIIEALARREEEHDGENNL